MSKTKLKVLPDNIISISNKLEIKQQREEMAKNYKYLFDLRKTFIDAGYSEDFFIDMLVNMYYSMPKEDL